MAAFWLGKAARLGHLVGFWGPRMNADERGKKHWELTERILAAFYAVWGELGCGFTEAIYREAMIIVLEGEGLRVTREYPLTARFRGRVVGRFRADLLVAGRVLVEVKAARALHSSHESQLLNYLRCSVIEVGLLLNFGPKPQVKRLVFANHRKNEFKRIGGH
jgi:GxxExxY protein